MTSHSWRSCTLAVALLMIAFLAVPAARAAAANAESPKTPAGKV
jgi:hypothetical protein